MTGAGNTRKKQIRIAARRRIIQSLLLRNAHATQRDIERYLGEQNFVNPDTGRPYSLGTINSDIQAIEEEWQAAALQDIQERKARRNAELEELKKDAWSAKDRSTVLAIIREQNKMDGAYAPARTETTINPDEILVVEAALLEKV